MRSDECLVGSYLLTSKPWVETPEPARCGAASVVPQNVKATITSKASLRTISTNSLDKTGGRSFWAPTSEDALAFVFKKHCSLSCQFEQVHVNTIKLYATFRKKFSEDLWGRFEIARWP